jgi:hypothetical protein
MTLSNLRKAMVFVPGRWGQVHASTLLRLPDGTFLAAWFGGTTWERLAELETDPGETRTRPSSPRRTDSPARTRGNSRRSYSGRRNPALPPDPWDQRTRSSVPLGGATVQ